MADTIITAQKSALVDAMHRAAAVAADAKSAMPILSHVYLESLPAGQLRFAATDLLQSVEGAIPATVSRPDKLCVSAKKLAEVIGVMPEGIVTLRIPDKRTTLIVTAAKRKFELAAMPGEDFPTVKRAEGNPITLDAALFVDLIKRTHAMMSTDDTRPHLAALFLAFGHGSLRACATDGHRLTVVEAPGPGDRRAPARSVLIPASSVKEIRDVLTGAIAEHSIAAKKAPKDSVGPGSAPPAPTFQFTADKTFVTVVAGDVVFTTKLVDAAFPSVDQVIPTTWTSTIRVARAGLLDAIRAVTTIGKDVKGIALECTAGELTISLVQTDVGEARDEVPVETEGNPPRTGLNAKYLNDAIGESLRGDEVELCLTGELDPIIVRPVGGAADGASGVKVTCIVMPMRV